MKISDQDFAALVAYGKRERVIDRYARLIRNPLVPRAMRADSLRALLNYTPAKGFPT